MPSLAPTCSPPGCNFPFSPTSCLCLLRSCRQPSHRRSSPQSSLSPSLSPPAISRPAEVQVARHRQETALVESLPTADLHTHLHSKSLFLATSTVAHVLYLAACSIRSFYDFHLRAIIGYINIDNYYGFGGRSNLRWKHSFYNLSIRQSLASVVTSEHLNFHFNTVIFQGQSRGPAFF